MFERCKPSEKSHTLNDILRLGIVLETLIEISDLKGGRIDGLRLTRDESFSVVLNSRLAQANFSQIRYS